MNILLDLRSVTQFNLIGSEELVETMPTVATALTAPEASKI